MQEAHLPNPQPEEPVLGDEDRDLTDRPMPQAPPCIICGGVSHRPWCVVFLPYGTWVPADKEHSECLTSNS